MAGINRLLMVLITVMLGTTAISQINSGKIVFERKTNLMKRFNDPRMKKFVNEDNKIKVDMFVLQFNDTSSVFTPIVSNVPDDMSWMTTRNTYYQNTQEQTQLSILSLMGQEIYIKDSLPVRDWKITESNRKIGNYECRKAIYEKNDSTRLYAWFSVDIVPSLGPEGFCGLPGMILGLATEDGGVIYFAKTIELIAPKKEELTYNTGKNKIFTLAEFKTKVETEYANTPWGKRIFDDLFRWL